MSLQTFEYSCCKHNFFPCNKTNSKDVKIRKPTIRFCKLCGIMEINSIILEKSKEFKNCCEFDQLFLYNEIVENSIQRDATDLNHIYLKRRVFLINYLRKMCVNFKFSEETFHQALEYADTILTDKSASGLKHDLIGLGCLLLAAKFVENDPTLPVNDSFLNPQRQLYEKIEIAHAELTCLQWLRYNIYTFSAYSVLKFFLNNGIVFNKDMNEINKLYSLSFVILNEIVNHPRRLIFSNLQIALSCIFLATTLINKSMTENMMYVLELAYDCKFDYFHDVFFEVNTIFLSSQIGNSNPNRKQNSKMQENISRQICLESSIIIQDKRCLAKSKSISNNQLYNGGHIIFNNRNILNSNSCEEGNQMIIDSNKVYSTAPFIPLTQSKFYMNNHKYEQAKTRKQIMNNNLTINHNRINNEFTPDQSLKSTNISPNYSNSTPDNVFVDLSEKFVESFYIEISEKEEEQQQKLKNSS